jgi:predicted TIM-barrel fold metal-dependent hydrolase
MLIDLHAHLPHPKFLEQDPYWGPFYETTPDGDVQLRVGQWKLQLATPERQAALKAGTLDSREETLAKRGNPQIRLAQMDAAEQDIQVLSLPSHYAMYWADADFGLRYARRVNDVMVEYCAGDPRRLKFWAHAPLQNPPAAAAELERAVRELGALGLGMGGANFGGLDVHDEAMGVLWAKCVELDVPLFVHGYNQSVTWGNDYVKEKYDYTAILGMLYDESRLFWSFVNGGVLDRFPNLKIYITHGGGFVPYQLGRMAMTNAVLRDAENARPLRAYLPNFYFDPLIHEVPMRQAIVEVIGADRLLYGSNFGGSDGIREDLTAALKLSPDDRDKIRWRNAAQLLRLDVKGTDSFVARKEERKAVGAGV